MDSQVLKSIQSLILFVVWPIQLEKLTFRTFGKRPSVYLGEAGGGGRKYIFRVGKFMLGMYTNIEDNNIQPSRFLWERGICTTLLGCVDKRYWNTKGYVL